MLCVARCSNNDLITEKIYCFVNKDVFSKIVKFLIDDALVWEEAHEDVLNIRCWSRRHKHFIDNLTFFWMIFVDRHNIICDSKNIAGSVIRFFALYKIDRSGLRNKELGKDLTSIRLKIARRKRKIEELEKEIKNLELEQRIVINTRQDNTKTIEDITKIYNLKKPKKSLCF